MSLSITQNLQKKRPNTEGILLGLFQGDRIERHPLFQHLNPSSKAYLKRFSKKGFFAESGEVDFVVFPNGRPSLAFLVGLGKRQKWQRRHFLLLLRRLVSLAGSQKVKSLSVDLPSLDYGAETQARMAHLAGEQLLFADYRFQKYKKHNEKKQTLRSVELRFSETAGVQRALTQAKIVGKYVAQCRDLANIPGGDMTPSVLADRARALARETGCTVTILDRKGMEKERMGAILGVAKGSSEEPKFIVMTYRGAGTAPPLVYVGKGVTFDSGGINLKPEQGMKDMHMDMAGGAAVLCACAAAAELKLPINVTAIVPAVENMPGGSGFRPGDVLVSRSGKTIEVANTDAEGRVILADALDYACDLKPQLIVDVATLTGAAMIALGYYRTALFASDNRFRDELFDLGERTGEYLWPLPLGDEYSADIKGAIGDISNLGKHQRVGGASYGAAFLQEFVQKVPWAHLDIAPTMTSVEGQYLAPGATGVGTHLLVALAVQRSKR